MRREFEELDRYLLITSDTHAGLAPSLYKPYLAKKWHSDFAAWVKSGEGTAGAGTAKGRAGRDESRGSSRNERGDHRHGEGWHRSGPAGSSHGRQHGPNRIETAEEMIDRAI